MRPAAPMLSVLSDRLLRQGLALFLGLALLVGQASPSLAAPWSKQRSEPSSTSGSASLLQEVAPPGAAQQLSDQLRSKQPQLSVVSPKPGSQVGAGDWTLQLQLDDWPVLESSGLGAGPHVVVQLDQQAPQRIFSSDSKGLISVAMPALTPGSHHLSAFAALPWGEAAAGKNARIQWQLYRGLATPEALPDLDAPQLVAVPPQQLAAGAAVPINWFLFNAPLQHLRDGDEQWRLRLSLDGSSVVLDRAQSLWLKPLKAGEHFLKLELLDGDGNPLQPAFNSLVQELSVPVSRAGAPAFFSNRLSADQLAELSDPNYQPAPEPEPEPEPAAEPEPEPAPEPAPEPETEAQAEPAAEPQADSPEPAAPMTQDAKPKAEAEVPAATAAELTGDPS
ncbi:MAG: hypothetical protein VYB57_04245 [Cyanobacteriota bacterium]|nr:hypothetical protein [Cyanobacteriota bacterium]